MKDKFYLPTPLESFALPFFTVLFMIMTNLSLVQARVFGGESGKQLGVYISTTKRLLDNEAINSLGVFFFWLIVGTLLYMLAGTIGLVINTYKTEIKGVWNVQYASAETAEANIKAEKIRLVIRSVAVAGYLLWLIITLRFSLLFMQRSFNDLVLNANWLAGAWVLVVGALTFFMPIVLTRLFVLRTRVWQRD